MCLIRTICSSLYLFTTSTQYAYVSLEYLADPNAGTLSCWPILSFYIEFSWREAVVHFYQMIHCFSCIHSCSHSFVASHCESAQLGLTPPPALSRLGGALWGRLLPPSLPSPLPFPGRGMTDLKGLSTEVLPLPLPVWRAATIGWWNSPSWAPQPSTTLLAFTVCGCFQFCQCVLPACMHHSASASVQLSETTSWCSPIWAVAVGTITGGGGGDDVVVLCCRMLCEWWEFKRLDA